jgi:hypothetical protein
MLKTCTTTGIKIPVAQNNSMIGLKKQIEEDYDTKEIMIGS